MMIEWTHSFAGALTGLVIGLTGVGGGALMAPILLLVFDISIATVVATDLWFAAFTKMAAVRVYNNHQYIDWSVAKRLWIGSIPASALVIIAVAGGGISKISDSFLQKGVGALILITSIGLLISEKLKEKELKVIPSELLKKISLKIDQIRSSTTIVVGGIIGFIVTLTSVGAGVLGTLALVYLYSSQMKPHNIVATDIAHAIPLALLAGIGYLICGKVDGVLLINLLIGSVPAAIFGASIAQKTTSKWLKVALATIMLLAGLKLIL